jgi:hypothetical protein
MVRFWNNSLFSEKEAVLEVIDKNLTHPHPPAGTFSRQRATVHTHLCVKITHYFKLKIIREFKMKLISPFVDKRLKKTVKYFLVGW